MTEYPESWRKALEERGMRVSRPKTQFMEFSFEQNAQGNRPQVQILGHVMRMEEDHVVRRVMTKAIPGKRKRGRPKTRWKDVCKSDMQTVGLGEGDEGDRAYWKETIDNHSGDPR